MPRMDGTGPQGAGALTGRGAGPCAESGYTADRSGEYGFGRGGRGSFRGCNFRQGFRNANYNGFSNRENLKRQKGFLKERLGEIEKQLEEL